ncbi:MAG: hypothetical protein KAS36_03865 [Anaerolineales bacterium]|nr:hypothetical protein [Anaerolineales bacterium]
MRNVVNELQAIKRRVIPVEMARMHEGRHFFVKGITSLDGAGTTGIFGFQTPANTWEVHAKAIINAEEQFDLEIWEGATVLNTGTAIPSFNNKRNSPNQPHLMAFANPQVSGLVSGTSIWKARTFSGKSAAGVAPALGYEIIAKSGCTYLWKITKVAAGEHYIDYDFFWNEELIHPND